MLKYLGIKNDLLLLLPTNCDDDDITTTTCLPSLPTSPPALATLFYHSTQLLYPWLLLLLLLQSHKIREGWELGSERIYLLLFLFLFFLFCFVCDLAPFTFWFFWFAAILYSPKTYNTWFNLMLCAIIKWMWFRFLLGRHFGWLHQLVGHCVGVRDLHLCNVGGDVLETFEGVAN